MGATKPSRHRRISSSAPPGFASTRRIIRLAAALVCLIALLGLTAQPSDRVSAEGGDIIVTPLIHASVQVEHAGRVVQIDPWTAGDLGRAKPADLILVTDDPGHHLDPAAIAQLRKPGAPVVLTAGAREKLGDGQVLANGQRGVFAGIEVEAIPAYDMTPGLPHHPKGEANGYVITLGERRLYFAGVTECVPEIQALQRIDVAFLPLNLPVDRMRPIPAAECVKTFRPAVVYLYHYDQPYARWLTNPQGTRPDTADVTARTLRAFREAIDGEPVEFRDAAWYPR